MDLTTLDPDAPLDDLDPLAALVGDARVVGIGESAHFSPEYHRLRHRLVRFLVERLGFEVVAFESGFSEGLAVDGWLRDGDGDLDAVSRRGLTNRFGESADLRLMLAWMREVNAAGRPLAFAGLDLPGQLASMLPALDSVAAVLGGDETLKRARALAARYAGEHTLPAFAAYLAMAQADRDALTVALAEVSARMDVLRRTATTVRHELRMAVLLDQQLRAQAAGLAMEVNVRDAAMAETVRHLGDRRIVIGAANNHLQRVPLMGRVPVLGSHLAAELGDGYLMIGMTAKGGHTVTRQAAPGAPGGVEVVTVALDEPPADSVEALPAGLTDLRAAGVAPARTRVMDTYLEMPVAEAFDLVAVLPEVSVDYPRELHADHSSA